VYRCVGSLMDVCGCVGSLMDVHGCVGSLMDAYGCVGSLMDVHRCCVYGCVGILMDVYGCVDRFVYGCECWVGDLMRQHSAYAMWVSVSCGSRKAVGVCQCIQKSEKGYRFSLAVSRLWFVGPIVQSSN